MEQRDIINECVKFLKDSSEYYSEFVQRKVRDMEMYSGNFWNDALIKEWKRKKRAHVHFSNWGTLENAISSPYTNSPWHIELIGKGLDDLQAKVNAFEVDSDAKNANLGAFRQDVIVGAGFGVITTVKDYITGEVKPFLECVEDISSVALDPGITTLSGCDAEAGAIVNYISLSKAKRLYGDDVVPMSYPNSQPILSNFGTQWENKPSEFVAIVSYFVKNESGMVDFYRICGDKVISTEHLPIDIIPIVRFAGYRVYRNGKVDYAGIVDKTQAIQLGINLGYSTLMERMNRAPKANFIFNVDAINGLESYVKKASDDDSVVQLYKGATPPIQIQESYQTADLIATIESSRTLMADIVGVPLAGINGINSIQKTATEILQQQTNAESNVSNFYQAAYEANRTIGRIVIMMLSGGKRVDFKLENGPDVITRQMKRRNELAAIAALVPDEMKPLLAKHYADTLDSDFADKVSADIIANMSADLKLVSEKPVDPNAVHTIKQLQGIIEQMKDKIDELVADNTEKQQQLDTLNLSMMNDRENREMEWQKFQITERDSMAIETAKLQQAGASDVAKLQLQQQKQLIEAEQEQKRLQLENDKEVAKVVQNAIPR